MPASPVPEGPFAASLHEMMKTARSEPALAGAALGVCVLDADGAVVFEDQARTAFIPASTLKTVTTATALEMLGPDFHFETRLAATGKIENGILSGDIILVGGADPMLGLDNLAGWVRELKKRGLAHIKGRVVGDGRVFKGSVYDDFWNWGDIGNGYGSAVSGLNVQHNRFLAQFTPGAEEGTPAAFSGAWPEVPGVEWLNEVRTGPKGSGDGVVIHGGERAGVIHLRGTVPASEANFTVMGAVPDPELNAAHQFRLALLAAGVKVDGAAVSASHLEARGEPVPEAREELLKHASPPLLEIITSIHAESDNHETECVFRLLGVREKSAPEEVVRKHWYGRGLDFKGLRMEDGCGLARADFIRPLDLARLQHLAATGPHGESYVGSLLSSRDGALRMKVGAMSGVRSYTGVITNKAGKKFYFALMMNHFTESGPIAVLKDVLLDTLEEP